MNEILAALLGGGPDTIQWWQMCLRAVLIFVHLIVLVRLGPVRMFGKITPFDIALAVILGSILSRALTANAELLPSLAATAALVLLHAALAKLTLRSRRFAWLVKGEAIQLVREGTLLRDGMWRASISEPDLREALRTNAGTDELGAIRAAYLERNGDLSFVRAA